MLVRSASLAEVVNSMSDCRQSGPQACAFQQGLRGLQKRGGAQVGPLRIPFRDRGRGIDAEHRKSRLPEKRCGRQPGDTAAGNHNININVLRCVLHWTASLLPGNLDLSGGQSKRHPVTRG